jgi:hypothetical protein
MLKKFILPKNSLGSLKHCLFRFRLQTFSLLKEDPKKKAGQMTEFNKFFLTKEEESQIQPLDNLPAISIYSLTL